jgi:hypothetical protein
MGGLDVNQVSRSLLVSGQLALLFELDRRAMKSNDKRNEKGPFSGAEL